MTKEQQELIEEHLEWQISNLENQKDVDDSPETAKMRQEMIDEYYRTTNTFNREASLLRTAKEDYQELCNGCPDKEDMFDLMQRFFEGL